MLWFPGHLKLSMAPRSRPVSQGSRLLGRCCVCPAFICPWCQPWSPAAAPHEGPLRVQHGKKSCFWLALLRQRGRRTSEALLVWGGGGVGPCLRVLGSMFLSGTGASNPCLMACALFAAASAEEGGGVVWNGEARASGKRERQMEDG